MLVLKLLFGPKLGPQMDPKLAQQLYMKGPRWLPQHQEALLELKVDKNVPKMGPNALPDPPVDQNMSDMSLKMKVLSPKMRPT